MIDTTPGPHPQTEGAGQSLAVVEPDRSAPGTTATDLLMAPSRPTTYLAGSARAPLPCQSHDPELFFAESPGDVETAKRLCAACPVRQLCLAAAHERREPWGVWGGELFKDGLVIARKRARGRPRKNAA
jgi:WhiB family transcriptional regulator, redox-sensing transcriptional regulator